MPTYTVKTRDVDCSTTRKFKTLAGARRRFEEMAGHTMEAAIAEQFHDSAEPPKAEDVRSLRTVSMFGTVVTLSAVVEPAVAEVA
jgi:hypothetical protein